MTRELFALIGDGAPPVQLVRPKMKDRMKLKAPAARWHLKPFVNGARPDGLALQHWVKEAEEEPTGACASLRSRSGLMTTRRVQVCQV
jgi:hypothetical protein